MAAPVPQTRGHDALAELFAFHPSLCIFRLFKDLNATNLLDLQAEIVTLRRRLLVTKRNDEKVSKCTETEPQNVFFIHSAGQDQKSCPYHEEIWAIKLQIRQKLKEYNEALLHFTRLTDHCKPSKRALKNLRAWLKHESTPNDFLRGSECFTWSEEVENDLACVGGQREDADVVSRWLGGPILEWCHNTFRSRHHEPTSVAEAQTLRYHRGSLYYYPDSYISNAVSTANTILAAILPSIPIFVLFYIQNQVARMGAILGMTFVFSTLVTLFTNATRVEVFTAATAFTAIQVVFVSTSNTTQIG